MTKIADNFDFWSNYMTFNSPDEFYFVQILVRGKDGHLGEKYINGNNKNRLIKFYTITDKEMLLAKRDEITRICDLMNARAYIHPTKRSFTAVATKQLQETVEMFTSKNFMGMRGAFSTAAGKSYITKDKTYVLDVDEFETGEKDCEGFTNLDRLINYLNCEVRPYNTYKVKGIVPTVHGFHILTIPFDTVVFNEKYPEIGVKKNNPSLLYYKTPSYEE